MLQSMQVADQTLHIITFPLSVATSIGVRRKEDPHRHFLFLLGIFLRHRTRWLAGNFLELFKLA
jgi:hypothetical protein